MTSKPWAAALLAALMGWAAGAQADEAAKNPGVYLGLQFGSMQKADLLQGHSDGYLGYVAGYRFDKEWSAELTVAGGFSCTFAFLGDVFGDPAKNRCETLKRHVGAYALYQRPLSGDFSYYGRLGLGQSSIETFANGQYGHYRRVEAGLGGGLAYEPWPSLSLRLDLQHLTRTKATSLSLQGIWHF